MGPRVGTICTGHGHQAGRPHKKGRRQSKAIASKCWHPRGSERSDRGSSRGSPLDGLKGPQGTSTGQNDHKRRSARTPRPSALKCRRYRCSCPKRESNPHGFKGHWILSPARLPIPPSGLGGVQRYSKNAIYQIFGVSSLTVWRRNPSTSSTTAMSSRSR